MPPGAVINMGGRRRLPCMYPTLAAYRSTSALTTFSKPATCSKPTTIPTETASALAKAATPARATTERDAALAGPRGRDELNVDAGNKQLASIKCRRWFNRDCDIDRLRD